jgi:glycolate oxidase
MNKRGCSRCSNCPGEGAICARMAKNGIAVLPQLLAGIFAGICGTEHVITDADILTMYSKDQTLDLDYPFDILVKPGSPEEISAILKICNQYKIPVTPRGGGSGVTGGALPYRGGVVLAVERLNKIISINKTDAYVIAESGITTSTLCQAVDQQGLYFPVVPSSSDYCCIGGNIAENAGSMHSCKYGTTSRYVLNLEVVLPTGEIIWTGANVLKNATGLNLTQLLIGSEGILGIVTKVVYRLLPKPEQEMVLLAAFKDLRHACEAVTAIRHSGMQPAVVELIGQEALQLTASALNRSFPLVEEGTAAHLLIELQEDSETKLNDSFNVMVLLLEKYVQGDMLVASTSMEKKRLRQLRFSIGDAMMVDPGMHYRDIDMAVPLSFLYPFIKKVEEICYEHQIRVICFGHALDGNLHTMLMRNKHADEFETENFNKAVEKIYRYGIANGGTISGEHGVGLLQNQFMHLQFSDTHLGLMKGIKSLFDPNGILNPGKIL